MPNTAATMNRSRRAVSSGSVVTGALVVVGGVGLGCGGDRGGVADRFDLGDDVVDGEAVGEGDGGLLGGVVHRCVDAVELVEALRDPGGARGAGHAADVEGDGRGGAGGRVGHRSHISMSGVPVTGPWSKVNEAVCTVPLCLKSKNRPYRPAEVSSASKVTTPGAASSSSTGWTWA